MHSMISNWEKIPQLKPSFRSILRLLPSPSSARAPSAATTSRTTRLAESTAPSMKPMHLKGMENRFHGSFWKNWDADLDTLLFFFAPFDPFFQTHIFFQVYIIATRWIFFDWNRDMFKECTPKIGTKILLTSIRWIWPGETLSWKLHRRVHVIHVTVWLWVILNRNIHKTKIYYVIHAQRSALNSPNKAVMVWSDLQCNIYGQVWCKGVT